MSQDQASQEPVEPGKLAQTNPLRSFDDMNTGQMVFELQGTVGEIKNAVGELSRKLDSSERRLETTDRTLSEIKNILQALVPKIEDVSGFVKHSAPHFATKIDIEKINSDISKRPTRWQAIIDFSIIAGLVAALVTIGARFAH